jgi:hypothetical protein
VFASALEILDLSFTAGKGKDFLLPDDLKTHTFLHRGELLTLIPPSQYKGYLFLN